MVMGLIKIGQAEYQKRLYERGEIFMQTLEYFRKLEDGNVRKDVYEGAEKILQVNWIKIADGNRDIEFSIKDGSMSRANYYSTPQTYCNAYCMIGITEDDKGKDGIIDSENMKFGEFMILIYNVKEFIKRVRLKLAALGIHNSWGPIKYYEEYDFQGNLSPFFKRKQFSAEKEVRIIAIPDYNRPIKLEIGSIQDIAIPMPISKLSKIRLLEDNRFEF